LKLGLRTAPKLISLLHYQLGWMLRNAMVLSVVLQRNTNRVLVDTIFHFSIFNFHLYTCNVGTDKQWLFIRSVTLHESQTVVSWYWNNGCIFVQWHYASHKLWYPGIEQWLYIRSATLRESHTVVSWYWNNGCIVQWYYASRKLWYPGIDTYCENKYQIYNYINKYN